MAARTGNLPQLGVTLLSGVLAEQLLARAPGCVARDGAREHAAPRRSRRRSRSRARRPGGRGSLYAEHAFHGLTLGSLSLNGNDEFRDGLRPAAARLRGGALRATSTRSERELARGDVAAFVVEPVQGKGVNLPPDGLPAGRPAAAAATPATLFVCDEVQTGHRAHRALPRAASTGALSPT